MVNQLTREAQYFFQLGFCKQYYWAALLSVCNDGRMSSDAGNCFVLVSLSHQFCVWHSWPSSPHQEFTGLDGHNRLVFLFSHWQKCRQHLWCPTGLGFGAQVIFFLDIGHIINYSNIAYHLFTEDIQQFVTSVCENCYQNNFYFTFWHKFVASHWYHSHKTDIYVTKYR